MAFAMPTFDAVAAAHACVSTVTAHPVAAFAIAAVAALVILAVTSLVVRPYLTHRFYSKTLGIPALPYRPVVGNIPEISEIVKQPYRCATTPAQHVIVM